MGTPQGIEHWYALQGSLAEIKNDRIPVRSNDLFGKSCHALAAKVGSRTERRIVNGFTNGNVAAQISKSHSLGEGVRRAKIVVLKIDGAQLRVVVAQ